MEMMKVFLASCCGNAPWTRGRQCLLLFMALLMVVIINLVMEKPLLSWFPSHCLTSSGSSNKSSNNSSAVDNEQRIFLLKMNMTFKTDRAKPYFVAYPHQYLFTLDEPDACRQEKPYLVIMIPVAPQNKEARIAIRKTWGGERKVLGKRVSPFFLLGQAKDPDKTLWHQLLHESQEHHDLLQGDFVDSYHNLTIKTMVMLEWLTSRCPNASYGMKIDSDIFLNVRLLIKELLRAPEHLYMTGRVVRHAYVKRDPNSKWFVPKEVSQYPPYMLGLGYVFSMDLPQILIEASRHVKAIWIEDVYLGLCMRYLGFELTENDLFKTGLPLLWKNNYWNYVITTILESPQQLLDVWRDYKT